MTQKLIALTGENEKLEQFPPITNVIVDKILTRDKEILSKEREIYDILVQSLEQSEADRNAYYKRAYSKNPQYMRYLFHMYNNTDTQDLQELLIDLPHKLSEAGATTAYITLEGENNYKKIGSRETLKDWLSYYISKSFIESIELKATELGINNLFEISFSIQQDGIKLWLYTVADFDGDVVEKTKEGGKDASSHAFSYGVNLDTTDKLVRFIRKLGGEEGDLKDMIMFD